MGHAERRDRGFQVEGAVSLDAGDICESDHARQAGDKERVRVSGLPDQNAWSYVRLDVQSEEPRQAYQVDPGRRRDSPADLSASSLIGMRNDAQLHIHTRFRTRNSFRFFSFFLCFMLPFASRNGNSRARG